MPLDVPPEFLKVHFLFNTVEVTWLNISSCLAQSLSNLWERTQITYGNVTHFRWQNCDSNKTEAHRNKQRTDVVLCVEKRVELGVKNDYSLSLSASKWPWWHVPKISFSLQGIEWNVFSSSLNWLYSPSDLFGLPSFWERMRTLARIHLKWHICRHYLFAWFLMSDSVAIFKMIKIYVTIPTVLWRHGSKHDISKCMHVCKLIYAKRKNKKQKKNSPMHFSSSVLASPMYSNLNSPRHWANFCWANESSARQRVKTGF